jgi:AcrR family transcriptional regulator
MPRIADPRAKTSLLRAAQEVFAERGLAGAKVEEITKRAGLSKGAFYLHFESKESALEHVVEAFLARCQSYFAPPSDYPDVPEDGGELLDFAIERDAQMFEFLWQNRATLRILASCQGDYVYLIEAFRREIDQRNRAWIEHFRGAGLFRADVDVDLASTMIGGAYNELTLKMMRWDARPPLEDWLRFAQETFTRAYGSLELIEALESRNRRVTMVIGRTAGRTAARGRL